MGRRVGGGSGCLKSRTGYPEGRADRARPPRVSVP